MTRKIYILTLLLFTALSISAQDMETAQEAVINMSPGWNLGNTLESNSGDTLNMWIEWNSKPIPTSKYETAWGQPVATRKLIHMFKEAGFKAIRVPVTWAPHMGIQTSMVRRTASEYRQYWYMSKWTSSQVDSHWMARVKEVVDYVIDEGMYCILNVHHDTGAANSAWLRASEDVYAKRKAQFESLWTQIANEFKDYDERLIFEGYNEMLDPYSSWCFASFGTTGNYDAAVATSAYNAINSYAQSFVDAVRATGGNNAQRNLLCNTYGACCGSGSWSSHLKEPLKNMKKPVDSAQDHIILGIHDYPSITSESSMKSDINSTISAIKTTLQTQAPVIFGEWGYSDGSDTVTYRKNILTLAKYFVQQAKAANMGMFYWMGLSDGSDRSVPKWTRPDIAQEMLKGYYGDDYDMNIGLSPADVNKDGVVNISDVNAVISVICGQSRRDADVNADGVVNIADVNAVISVMCGN